MNKRFAVLFFFLVLLAFSSAEAETLGPAFTYNQMADLAMSAESGDVLLISGRLYAPDGEMLCLPAPIHITSDGERASISGLQLFNSSAIFSEIDLVDTLRIAGTSHIELQGDVRVTGADGCNGLDFSGSGSLLISPGCKISGGTANSGLYISHSGGDLYVSMEGTVIGGSGATGGPGLTVAPLTTSGTMLLSGSISGGEGTVMGGNGLNLYNLSGNAFITVDGSIKGGSASIGGDGVQLVAMTDTVSIGIQGSIWGGNGETYGGDALILMNAGDRSNVNISGELRGGSASEKIAHPGQSLLVVHEGDNSHLRLDNCFLQDGAATYQDLSETPAVTPLPQITASLPYPLPTPNDNLSVPDEQETPAPHAAPKPTSTPLETNTPDAVDPSKSPNPPDPSTEPDSPQPSIPDNTPDASESPQIPDPAETPPIGETTPGSALRNDS